MRPCILLVLSTFLLLAGCSAPTGNALAVRIEGNAYMPSSLTVAPGTGVTVINADGTPHTLTGAGFDTGTLAAGATGSFVAPAKTGTHGFTCAYHPEMKGNLVVAE